MTADPKTFPPVSDSEPPQAKLSGNFPVASDATASGGGDFQLWLIRIRSLLMVTLCATLGVLLVILPWTPRWTDNPLLLTWPSLREIVASGFARGVSTGLGVLDLWLGFWEAIHYHENPKGSG